jgi:chemotaxis protein histidine kinase CheA
VVVMMGERWFAFDANAVRGMLPMQEAASQTVFADGIVYPPLAFTDLLEVDPNEDSSDRRVLLLAHQDRYGCIGVDRVHGQLACQGSEVVPLPLHFQGAEREWYLGMILFQESVAVILNVSWVLSGSQPEDGVRQPEWSTDSMHGCVSRSTGETAQVQKC